MHLTSTRQKDFETCPELFRSRWEHRLDPVYAEHVKGPLDAGDILHACIAEWYRSEDRHAAMDILYGAWVLPDSPLHVETGKYTRAHLEEVLEMYMDLYPADAEEVLEVEQRRIHDLRSVHYGVKRDLMVQSPFGPIIQDTKTTSMYQSAEVKQASHILSQQQRGYVATARMDGHDVRGVRIDRIHLDLKGKKVKPEHFERLPIIMFTDEQLTAWEKDLHHTVAQIRALRATRGPNKRWPQHTQSCVSFNRPCAFLPRCLNADPNALDVPNPLRQGEIQSYMVREKEYDDE